MSLFSVLATSKVAAGVLAAGAVAAGGTGVAAFNGALPADLQQGAHNLVGAPAPAVEKAATGVNDAADAATAKASDAVATAKSTAADAKEAGPTTPRFRATSPWLSLQEAKPRLTPTAQPLWTQERQLA